MKRLLIVCLAPLLFSECQSFGTQSFPKKEGPNLGLAIIGVSNSDGIYITNIAEPDAVFIVSAKSSGDFVLHLDPGEYSIVGTMAKGQSALIHRFFNAADSAKTSFKVKAGEILYLGQCEISVVFSSDWKNADQLQLSTHKKLFPGQELPGGAVSQNFSPGVLLSGGPRHLKQFATIQSLDKSVSALEAMKQKHREGLVSGGWQEK